MSAPDARPTLATLYPPLAPALHAWACVRLGSDRGRIAAEDLTQEIWLRALQRFAHWDPQKAPFRAWLFTVAKMVLLEARRRQQKLAAEHGAAGSSTRLAALDQLPADISTITRHLARDEQVQQFVARLGELDPIEQQTVLHCGLEGMPIADAAARVGEKAATTAKRWQRLRERMTGWAVPLGMVEAS
jgi:RNA polymerase sigma-70 factor, ECF subfamily